MGIYLRADKLIMWYMLKVIQKLWFRLRVVFTLRGLKSTNLQVSVYKTQNYVSDHTWPSYTTSNTPPPSTSLPLESHAAPSWCKEKNCFVFLQHYLWFFNILPILFHFIDQLLVSNKVTKFEWPHEKCPSWFLIASRFKRSRLLVL